MDTENSISCVPPEFRGIKILLVDNDTTYLSNIASTLEENSYRVTTSERATIALSILREQIDEFNLVIADVNMTEMNYLEFMRSTQLIKNIPIILMSSMMKREMVEEAQAQGAYIILMKPIPTHQLMYVWKYVYMHRIEEASQKSEHDVVNSVEVMDSESCVDEGIQDRKGKAIVNPSETDEETKNAKEGRKKKRPPTKWTPEFEKKFQKAIRKLGEKARPKCILKLMNVPNLNARQVGDHLKKYRLQKQEDQHLQQEISYFVNQFNIMSRMPPSSVPLTHSQDGVNEGYHQLGFHEEEQPLNIESTVGKFSSVGKKSSGVISHAGSEENENHYNVMNSNEFLMNFDESLQEAHLPQPTTLPSLVTPDDFFGGSDFRNQDLELDQFNDKMTENQVTSSLVTPDDIFAGLDFWNQDLELDQFNDRMTENQVGNNGHHVSTLNHFTDNEDYFNAFNHFLDNGNDINVLNSIEFPMNFNEPIQEAHLPQPPAVPSLVSPNDFFTGLNGWNEDLELDHLNDNMTENQFGTSDIGYHVNTLNHFTNKGYDSNELDPNEFLMNFNESFQEPNLLQPSDVPSLVPPNDLFTELETLLSTSSNQDDISTRNQNP